MFTKNHVHAECLSKGGDLIANGAATKNTEGRAPYIENGCTMNTKMGRARPCLTRSRLVIRQGATKRKNKANHAFAYALSGVARYIGHDDAMFATGLQIDAVIASGGNADKLQTGQACQNGWGQFDLVRDANISFGQRMNDSVRILGSGGEIDPFSRPIRDG